MTGQAACTSSGVQLERDLSGCLFSVCFTFSDSCIALSVLSVSL
jgi:hypothetical protein